MTWTRGRRLGADSTIVVAWCLFIAKWVSKWRLEIPCIFFHYNREVNEWIMRIISLTTNEIQKKMLWISTDQDKQIVELSQEQQQQKCLVVAKSKDETNEKIHELIIWHGEKNDTRARTCHRWRSVFWSWSIVKWIVSKCLTPHPVHFFFMRIKARMESTTPLILDQVSFYFYRKPLTLLTNKWPKSRECRKRYVRSSEYNSKGYTLRGSIRTDVYRLQLLSFKLKRFQHCRFNRPCRYPLPPREYPLKTPY